MTGRSLEPQAPEHSRLAQPFRRLYFLNRLTVNQARKSLVSVTSTTVKPFNLILSLLFCRREKKCLALFFLRCETEHLQQPSNNTSTLPIRRKCRPQWPAHQHKRRAIIPSSQRTPLLRPIPAVGREFPIFPFQLFFGRTTIEDTQHQPSNSCH